MYLNKCSLSNIRVINIIIIKFIIKSFIILEYPRNYSYSKISTIY